MAGLVCVGLLASVVVCLVLFGGSGAWFVLFDWFGFLQYKKYSLSGLLSGEETWKVSVACYPSQYGSYAICRQLWKGST